MPRKIFLDKRPYLDMLIDNQPYNSAYNKGGIMHNDYQLPRDGLIRLKDVLKVIPVCPATWYKGIKDGIYPKPVKLGKRAAAYHVQDIRKLIEQRRD